MSIKEKIKTGSIFLGVLVFFSSCSLLSNMPRKYWGEKSIKNFQNDGYVCIQKRPYLHIADPIGWIIQPPNYLSFINRKTSKEVKDGVWVIENSSISWDDNQITEHVLMFNTKTDQFAYLGNTYSDQGEIGEQFQNPEWEEIEEESDMNILNWIKLEKPDGNFYCQ